jgi:hypothetical protein
MLAQPITGSTVAKAAARLVTVYKKKNQRLQRGVNGTPTIHKRAIDPELMASIHVLQSPKCDLQTMSCCNSFDYLAFEKSLP